MSKIPAELSYTASHEWACEENGVWTVGLTDYAQSTLGGIVFIELPAVGDAVTADERFADVESVKAVSEVFSPVTGTVCAVNEALADSPEMINDDPYGAWLIKVEGKPGKLLTAKEYEAEIASQEG